MKSIQVIQVICFPSLVFVTFFTIIKEIKLSTFKWLKENTCTIATANKPTPKMSRKLLILYADMNILVMIF